MYHSLIENMDNRCEEINDDLWEHEKSDTLLHIGEQCYTVKEFTSFEEKVEAYKHRHRVFSEELQWVPQSAHAYEIDRYDDNAQFIGVFNIHMKLVAFLRLISSGQPFMIEKEFLPLVGPSHSLRKAMDTAEISRLCVAPEERRSRIGGEFGNYNISLLLYKGVYHWCIMNRIRYMYLVVDSRVMKLLLLQGFPCETIGHPVAMPPKGVTSVAAILDWRKFEALNYDKRPDMMAWFTQYRSACSELQLPQLVDE